MIPRIGYSLVFVCFAHSCILLALIKEAFGVLRFGDFPLRTFAHRGGHVQYGFWLVAIRRNGQGSGMVNPTFG